MGLLKEISSGDTLDKQDINKNFNVLYALNCVILKRFEKF